MQKTAGKKEQTVAKRARTNNRFEVLNHREDSPQWQANNQMRLQQQANRDRLAEGKQRALERQLPPAETIERG